MKIALRPFSEEDFPHLIEWVCSSELLVQWAGPAQFVYPLTTEQLSRYLAESRCDKPVRKIFTAIDERGTVSGHIEIAAINYANETGTLCRVFIAPHARGTGCCLPMVQEALRIGFNALNLRRIDLRVYSFNRAAIRCYQNAGFLTEGLLRRSQKMGDQYWDTVLMAALREEWMVAGHIAAQRNPVPVRFTDRLALVAATPELARAELKSGEELAALLGACVPEGWPPGEYDRTAQEFFLKQLEAGGEAVIGWYSWYAVLRGSAERKPLVIGAAGFLGPPDDSGEIEIGYSVMPDWQGHGYAGEIVKALLERAFSEPRVQRVAARTTTDNPASCKVLERAGFRFVGPGPEPGSVRYMIHRTD